MNHFEYLQKSGISQRAVAYRFIVCGIGAYQKDAILTIAQIGLLSEKYGAQNGTRKVAQKSVSIIARNDGAIAPHRKPQTVAQTPQIEMQVFAQNVAQNIPQKDSANVESVILFYSPFAVTLISIALTSCGLFMFAGWYGAGLGSMFGLFLFSAALVARNSQKGDTSLAALNTVLQLEIGACILHPFTFYHSFMKMGVNAEWWLLVCASVVCSIFVAIISYNSVMLIRNYNAE